MILPRSIITIRLFVYSLLTSVITAGEPMAVRVDQLIDSAQIGPVSALASDAEFLRRVTLDLHGTIPSSSEARAFIDDPSPNKRETLVDRILANPRFAVHMATVFDVMLMERRGDKYVTTPEWQKYLQTAFEKNKPYNELAREILSSDGVDPELRPAGKFFLDRDAEPHIMARDVGRIFFGMDLQCAQCHDHPLVDHYLQTDYYGLFAFVNRTFVFADPVAKKSYLAEKSDGDANYKSVFTQDAGQIRPQLPGDNEIDEPRFHQGEDYAVAPLPNVRPVPKYSRRAKLAELATSGANRQFNLNIANRLWAHMMGRGLVHPVDLHHSLNPPTHPAVLELITNEFVAQKYDVRWLLRELALTKTYQRSIEPSTADLAPQLAAASDRVPALTADYQTSQAVADESRKQVDAAQTEFKAARTTLAAAETAWRTAEAGVTAVKKPVDDSAAAIAKAQSDASAKQAAINAINEATSKSTEAAKLLPNDKEVALAVATLTAKQQQLAVEFTAIQKSITDQTAAQQPLRAKLVEAYAPADAAYAAYMESRKPVDAAKAKLIAVWNQHKSEALVAATRKKQLDRNRTVANYRDTISNVAITLAAVETRKSELASATQSAESQQVAVTNLTSTVAEIEKLGVDAGKLLSETTTQLNSQQSVVTAVTEALAKTDAALQKLPGDPDLTSIVQKLKERLAPLAKESATLEQAVATRDAAVKEVAAKLATSKQLLEGASTEMANLRQAVTTKTNDANQATAALRTAESNVISGREQLVDLWTIGAGVRPLKQVSPEQLAWAMMQAAGVMESQRAAAEAEVEKSIPKASVATDAAVAKTRELKVEQQLNEQMRGHAAPIVNLYAASAGQPQEDFFATPDQALFLANGGSLIGWASGGLLAQRLGTLTDANAFAEELYISILTRRPTEIEIKEVSDYINFRATERPKAIRELIWSLLTSTEFRFNH